MRIVGGKYRSRILKEFDFSFVRPTADNVRENLFNIIKEKTEGGTFLDLFCGTGAVGIEALSRGAREVFFNDVNKESIKLAKENVSLIVKDKSNIHFSNLDYNDFEKGCSTLFDIIYLDPPYNSGCQTDAISLFADKIKDDGVIVLEDEKPFNEDIPSLIKTDERKYGRVYLTFFKKAIRQNKACLFAGTFDPVTKGHIAVINECKKRYKRVYVAIGKNSDKTPLFSLEDRIKFLKTAIDDESVIVDSYEGYTVDYIRENGIDVYVRGIRDKEDLKFEKKALAFNKTLYPDLNTEFIFVNESERKYSSTTVRKLIETGKEFSEFLPNGIVKFVKERLNKE